MQMRLVQRERSRINPDTRCAFSFLRSRDMENAMHVRIRDLHMTSVSNAHMRISSEPTRRVNRSKERREREKERERQRRLEILVASQKIFPRLSFLKLH